MIKFKKMVFYRIFILFILTITSAQSNENALKIAKASYAPFIDGKLDFLWRSATVNHMTAYVNHDEAVEDWFDLFGSYRILWYQNNLLIYISIMDDELDVSSNDYLQNDGVEITFRDKQNTKIFIEVGSTQAVNGPNSIVGFQKTAYGYDIECQMPSSDCFVDFNSHNIFGFNLIIFDADEQDGKIDHQLAWSETDDVGQAQLIEYIVSDTVNIERTHVEPLIDGVLDDLWLDAYSINPNFYVEEGVTEMFIQQKDWNDNWFSCRALWNEKYLFIYFKGYDDELKTSNSASYANDACEFYFDGDNSKTIGDNHSSYDSNDFQLRIGIDGNLSGDNDRLEPDKYGFKETEDGWDMEFSFKMEDIGMTPAANHLFGFEVQKDDNDDVDRSSIVKWWADGHESWINPSVFGTAKLVDRFAAAISNDTNIGDVTTFNFYQNYPNPFNQSTTIRYELPTRCEVDLSIYNVTGQKVFTLISDQQSTGSYNYIWNCTGEIPSGIYFCCLRAFAIDNGGESYRKMMKFILLK
jgi:hypothetical protein